MKVFISCNFFLHLWRMLWPRRFTVGQGYKVDSRHGGRCKPHPQEPETGRPSRWEGQERYWKDLQAKESGPDSSADRRRLGKDWSRQQRLRHVERTQEEAGECTSVNSQNSDTYLYGSKWIHDHGAAEYRLTWSNYLPIRCLIWFIYKLGVLMVSITHRYED